MHKSYLKLITLFVLFFISLFGTVSARNAPQVASDTVEFNIKDTVPLGKTKMIPVGETEIKILGVKEVSSGRVPRNPPAPGVKEKVINHIFNSQNADGSWGTKAETKFITTVAVLRALQANHVSGEEVDRGIEWLSSYFADNTDFLAQKLLVTIAGGEATSSAETLLNDFDEASGGFVFDRGYQPDILTTAKVVQALTLAGYKDQGIPNIHRTSTLALNYLIDAKLSDNSWGAFSGGVSSIPATSEVIEALLLWKHHTLTVPTVHGVDDTLYPAINSLKSSQLQNGSWGNNILDTALAYHAIKAAEEIPTYEAETITYFENEQLNDGSFAGDVYKSAKVLNALSVSTNITDLVVEDITPELTIPNDIPATFTLRVSNKGNRLFDSGFLHLIADNVFLRSVDLGAANVFVNPGSTADISFSINSTRNFIGNVAFKVFVEGAGGEIYPNSFYKETINFTPDSLLRPGLPMYFVAYKGTSTSGTPAITWRWPIKIDPNLKTIQLLFRKLGDTAWSAANITNVTTQSSATVSGLIEGQIYEARLGALNINGEGAYYGTPAQIKVSANPALYTSGSVSGTVKAIDGTVGNVQITGVTAGTNTTSNLDGTFTQNNIPWGIGYARVNDLILDSFLKRYATANNAGTGFSLYTNKKPDLSITRFFAFTTAPTGANANSQTFTAQTGKTVHFATTFKNANFAPTGKHTLGVYVDNVLIASCEVARLDKDESKTSMCGNWIATAGVHSIKAVIDAGGAIEETDENNNTSIKTLTVTN